MMDIDLFDKNGGKLKIHNLEKHLIKARELSSLFLKNPTKGINNKFISLVSSEIWSTLFTEGEISSRRSIERISRSQNFISENDMDKYIESFFIAYRLVLDKKEFSISNFFNIYSVLSKYGIDLDSKLKDGDMFRDDKVFISSGSIKNEYEGYSPNLIKESLLNLCSFLNNNDDLNLYIKSIVGHLYFEMIHPYFDYNGRTGRFIPLWLFNNHDRVNEMMYFATAIGNYKETYVSIFRNTIDPRTNNIKLDYFINKILDLLILNQKQYIWYKNFENKYIDKTRKSFNNIQKNFIWALMIKIEKQNNANSWNTLDEEMKDYIESEIKQSQLARDVNILIDSGFVLKSDTKPVKYKLPSYTLLKNEDI